MQLNDEARQRYSRHLQMPEIGETGQRKLLNSSVLVVGAGGLGGTVSYYLSASGVGTIGLVDPDRVELSNLQRQLLYSESDVGRSKVEAARDRLLDQNSGLSLQLHETKFDQSTAEEILEAGEYDVIVDAVDNLKARRAMNRVSVSRGLPLVHGAVYRFEGEATTFLPAEGPCYSCLYGDREPDSSTPGPASFTPGIIGTVEAAEAVKYLAGIGELLTGRLLRIESLKMNFSTLEFSIDPGCPVCGGN